MEQDRSLRTIVQFALEMQIWRNMQKYAEILLLQLDPGRVKLSRGNLK